MSERGTENRLLSPSFPPTDRTPCPVEGTGKPRDLAVTLGSVRARLNLFPRGLCLSLFFLSDNFASRLLQQHHRQSAPTEARSSLNDLKLRAPNKAAHCRPVLFPKQTRDCARAVCGTALRPLQGVGSLRLGRRLRSHSDGFVESHLCGVPTELCRTPRHLRNGPDPGGVGALPYKRSCTIAYLSACCSSNATSVRCDFRPCPLPTSRLFPEWTDHR